MSSFRLASKLSAKPLTRPQSCNMHTSSSRQLILHLDSLQYIARLMFALTDVAVWLTQRQYG